nr:flagellar hook-basal body protein [Metabacillus iocasae]
MIHAANTMSQLQQRLDLISHNVANVNTVGYKKREATFSEMLYQQFDNQFDERFENNRLTPMGIRQGVGAKIGATKLLLTQGAIQQTERPLDVAFSKAGMFFQVLVEQNGQQAVKYTRSGNFQLTPVGQNDVMLVSDNGYPILDANGNSIVFSREATDITITASGEIVAQSANGIPQTFELGLVQVNRPQLLVASGGNLFELPPNQNAEEIVNELIGVRRQEAGIQQGALEQSNVDLSKEMSEMMLTQRAYQFNSRSISMSDQMMGLVNSIRS